MVGWIQGGWKREGTLPATLPGHFPVPWFPPLPPFGVTQEPEWEMRWGGGRKGLGGACTPDPSPQGGVQRSSVYCGCQVGVQEREERGRGAPSAGLPQALGQLSARLPEGPGRWRRGRADIQLDALSLGSRRPGGWGGTGPCQQLPCKEAERSLESGAEASTREG